MILVSACLLGEKIRYNNTALKPDGCWLEILGEKNRLLPFCPEMSAGLPTPRPCAEIAGGNGHDVLRGRAQVFDCNGNNLTKAFILGARYAFDFCVKNEVGLALLAEKSPSCGSSCIYDGTFSGGMVEGKGVSAALLAENGIAVFNQDQLSQVLAFLVEQNRV